MLRHADIWQGIDKLARDNGLTPSGLARRAGLDPTTFNKSKRHNRDGKPRWPSTESIAKILEVTDCTLAGFAALIGEGDAGAVAPPVSVAGSAPEAQSRAALHYIDGEWLEGNPKIMGPMTNGAWMASVVFDGARAFAGAAPDLDRHARRILHSARVMGLGPKLGAADIEDLIWQGIAKFPADAELYIRPMFFAEDGFVVPKPESTRFVLSIFTSALPAPDGFAAALSPFRRPSPETAPTEAKASCLYPQSARAMTEVRKRGFNVAVMLDMDGNVAEFSTANLFMVKDGAVHTPVPNGTFLDGITRQRVISLLARDGAPVVERSITYGELADADEIFATGNYAKVTPLIRLEGRDFQPGPVYAKARALYFEFAKGCTRPRV
ncbi:MAG: branched-chain amino acid aminotransferase [Alphaproteobacteria bacterium]